jgi:phage tail protein X
MQGDTWDIIAKREYGKETLMDKLIQANFELRKYVIFPAGVTVIIPDVDMDKYLVNENLPIWKRQ